MEIRHLEYFLEVARYKSFSKAAQICHISQSAISKAIKELENEIKEPLFYRSTKYVKLTDVGERIIGQIEQIVSAFNNIRYQVEAVEQLQTGQIHIGIPPITAVTQFSHTLSAFKQKYPNIQIHLYEYGPKKIETALKEDLLDIGIFTPENPAQFEWIWFEKDYHSVVMNVTHPLVRQRGINYTDLEGERLIIYNDEYKLHDIFLDGCYKAGITPNIAFETSQKSLMTQMAEAGLGLAVLPRKICKKLPKGLTSRPLKDKNLCLQLALAWNKERYLSYSTRMFLDFAKNEFEAGK